MYVIIALRVYGAGSRAEPDSYPAGVSCYWQLTPATSGQERGELRSRAVNYVVRGQIGPETR